MGIARGTLAGAVLLMLLLMAVGVTTVTPQRSTPPASIPPASLKTDYPGPGSQTSPFVEAVAGNGSVSIPAIYGDTLVLGEAGFGIRNCAPGDSLGNVWHNISGASGGSGNGCTFNATVTVPGIDNITFYNSYQPHALIGFVVEVVLGQVLANGTGGVSGQALPINPGALSVASVALFWGAGGLFTPGSTPPDCSTSGGTAWRVGCAAEWIPTAHGNSITAFSQNVSAHATPQFGMNNSQNVFHIQWVEIPLQPPPAPINVVTSGATTSALTVTWTNPPGTVLNDTIYYGSSPTCFGVPTAISAGDVTTHTITGLSAGLQTYLEVTAWNATGQSGKSSCVAGATLPNAPTFPVATPASTTSITVNWTNAGGTLNNTYVYWEAGSSCSAPAKIILGYAGTSYTKTGLTTDALYCFYVKAGTQGGIGAATSIVTAVTEAVPGAPYGLTVSSTTSTTIGLTWSNPSGGGLLNTTVYWTTTPSCAGSLNAISVGSAVTSYSFLAPYSKTTFYLEVTVWNYTSQSAASSCVPGTTTSGLSFSIVTSALPVSFVGTNFTYVIEASIPVNAWTALAGAVLVVYTPGSQQATIRGSPGAGTDSIHIRAQVPGYNLQYQNWTMVVYNLPFISSLPAFVVNAGSFYNYTPTGSVSGTWSFSGAPYLTLTSSSTGNVRGTVTSGTYVNRLTLNTSLGNFSQFWITTNGTSLPPGVMSFNCVIGFHSVAVTFSTTAGVPAGCGNKGLFAGDQIMLVPQTLTGAAGTPFQFGYSQLTGLSIYLGVGASTSPSNAGVTAYFYSTPGTAGAVVVNGGILSHPLFPSGGFLTQNFTPGLNTTCPGGCSPGGPQTCTQLHDCPVQQPTGIPVAITVISVLGFILISSGAVLMLAFREHWAVGGLVVLFGFLIVFASGFVTL